MNNDVMSDDDKVTVIFVDQNVEYLVKNDENTHDTCIQPSIHTKTERQTYKNLTLNSTIYDYRNSFDNRTQLISIKLSKIKTNIEDISNSVDGVSTGQTNTKKKMPGKFNCYMEHKKE